jgi:hypothetical protein
MSTVKIPNPMLPISRFYRPLFYAPDEVHVEHVPPPKDGEVFNDVRLYRPDGEVLFSQQVHEPHCIILEEQTVVPTDSLHVELKALIRAEYRAERLRQNRRFSAALMVLALIFLAGSLYSSVPYEPALAILLAVAGLFIVFQMKISELRNGTDQTTQKD